MYPVSAGYGYGVVSKRITNVHISNSSSSSSSSSSTVFWFLLFLPLLLKRKAVMEQVIALGSQAKGALMISASAVLTARQFQCH